MTKWGLYDEENIESIIPVETCKHGDTVTSFRKTFSCLPSSLHWILYCVYCFTVRKMSKDNMATVHWHLLSQDQENTLLWLMMKNSYIFTEFPPNLNYSVLGKWCTMNFIFIRNHTANVWTRIIMKGYFKLFLLKLTVIGPRYGMFAKGSSGTYSLKRQYLCRLVETVLIFCLISTLLWSFQK